MKKKYIYNSETKTKIKKSVNTDWLRITYGIFVPNVIQIDWKKRRQYVKMKMSKIFENLL